MPTDPSAAIVAGSFSVLAVGVGWLIDRHKTRVELARVKKIPIYEQLIEHLVRGAFDEEFEPADDPTYAAFAAKLLPWASTEVLEAYLVLRGLVVFTPPGEKIDGQQFNRALTDLLAAIRQDLGHRAMSASRLNALLGVEATRRFGSEAK